MDPLFENSVCQENGVGSSSMEVLIPKKVRFRDKADDDIQFLLVDPSPITATSWKDKLLGRSSSSSIEESEDDDDLELREGNIQISIVNGIPSIVFSERLHQILIKDMENTVILKLLG